MQSFGNYKDRLSVIGIGLEESLNMYQLIESLAKSLIDAFRLGARNFFTR